MFMDILAPKRQYFVLAVPLSSLSCSCPRLQTKVTTVLQESFFARFG